MTEYDKGAYETGPYPVTEAPALCYLNRCSDTLLFTYSFVPFPYREILHLRR